MKAAAGHLRFREEDSVAAIEEDIRPLSTTRLGILLRELRESRNLALRDVALLPELRSELEAVEAGLLRPDATIVEALLRCYDADLDDLVPPRYPPAVIEETDSEVLTRYLAAVRRGRGRAKHPILREADLQILAGILGTDPRDIQRRLLHHAIEERIAPLSTARLRVVVQKLRDTTRFARHHQARPSELLQAQLDDVEADRLRPDAAILEALLNYCDADLDNLVPPRKTLVVTDGTHNEVLTRYLSAVRRWRGKGKHPHLRENDLQVLAGILGTNSTDIERRLQKLTGCSRRRARRLTALLLASMAVAPAVANLHSNPGASATAATTQNAVLGSNAQLAGATRSASARITAAAVHTVAPVHTVAADCATALAYLAAHAKPGFAHYCRPRHPIVGITNAVAYTCVPGPSFACPDGNPEIIIADPACAASYENEASNSYWDFNAGTVIQQGATQDGRTWDPYGECT